VQQLRAQRDQARVDAILARIEAAARTPDAPLMPLFVEAVEAYATLGEITDVLRQVFGEYRAQIVV
jgi:methylmalonyl-CoA mutase N-terminal domain/subunit